MARRWLRPLDAPARSSASASHRTLPGCGAWGHWLTRKALYYTPAYPQCKEQTAHEGPSPFCTRPQRAPTGAPHTHRPARDEVTTHAAGCGADCLFERL